MADPWGRAAGVPRRRVLIVSYAFPPVGGAGVQRATKFVKYLPHVGWTPTVLVAANPSVPVLDHSLAADVPADTLVCRARTFEPSYGYKQAGPAPIRASPLGDTITRLTRVARSTAAAILQPDPAILWAPAAIVEGRRLLADVLHSAILVSGPPFSSFLIGRALQRASGLPLVLDYRDEWELNHRFLENRRVGPIAAPLQRAMQRRVVRAASALIATTTRSQAALERVRDEAGSRAFVTCIHNGFDPDDFAADSDLGTRPDRSRVRLVYAGTLWNLTSVEPLVKAIRLVSERAPAAASRLEVVFAGRRTPEQQSWLHTLTGTPVRIVELPYLDHETVLGLVRSADALCALLTDTPDAARVLPGKVFEYMACDKPILAIAPHGELWDLLERYPHAHRFVPSAIADIARYLEGQTMSGPPQLQDRPVVWDKTIFDRRYQARQLANVLDAVADAANPAARPAVARYA